ncbi:MAG: hypothetical protein WBH86_03770 [Thermogutta sp.]
MPDRLPLQLTPKERLEHAAAILAQGVARYLRNPRPDAAHLPVPSGPQKPPEFLPQGLELSENPRLTVS